MENKIVLVTGMSGAGKSSAMNALEDLGYYCMDNFPKELLDNLEDLLRKDEPHYKNVALSVSAIDYQAFVSYFENINRDLQILFLLLLWQVVFYTVLKVLKEACLQSHSNLLDLNMEYH